MGEWFTAKHLSDKRMDWVSREQFLAEPLIVAAIECRVLCHRLVTLVNSMSGWRRKNSRPLLAQRQQDKA
jgi:hypothetical protein